MKDMPGGTWIVMEGTPDKEGVDLVIVGYKYNKSKVLTFVMSKGAASTEAGKPYEAKFPDRFGNVCVRYVDRPMMVALIFTYLNVIDVWNQLRQFDLGLEKKWVTTCGYFRILTTFYGFTVAEVYKLYPLVIGKRGPSRIADLVDELSGEMLTEAEELEKEKQRTTRSGSVRTEVVEVVVAGDTSTVSSPTTTPQHQHTKLWLKGGKQARCVWCSRVNFALKKTTMMCIECNKGFCRDNTGRFCWSHHVALGGCPLAPARGKIQENMKRKADS